MIDYTGVSLGKRSQNNDVPHPKQRSCAPKTTWIIPSGMAGRKSPHPVIAASDRISIRDRCDRKAQNAERIQNAVDNPVEGPQIHRIIHELRGSRRSRQPTGTSGRSWQVWIGWPLQVSGGGAAFSGNQMRRHDADEFARGNHGRLFPESRKVSGVAGHEIVGTGGVCAFEENIVGGIGCHPKRR